MRILILVLAIIFTTPHYASGFTTVRIRPPQSEEDLSHDYFVQLLELALRKTQKEYGGAAVKITDFNVSQGRALKELKKSRHIDADWAGTSTSREKELRAIRIPLLGGLLGCRIPVIRDDAIPQFSKIHTLDDLKKFTAIQGTHWPDTAILANAGIRVQTTPRFELMYQMLADGRVDFFPRGINEAYAEFSKTYHRNLALYDSLLIKYTMPMYFFTSKRNKPLAIRIEKGLRAAIADGSFIELLKTHPATAQMFPLSKYDNATVIELKNPELPPKTPLEDSSLWFKIGRPSACSAE